MYNFKQLFSRFCSVVQLPDPHVHTEHGQLGDRMRLPDYAKSRQTDAADMLDALMAEVSRIIEIMFSFALRDLQRGSLVHTSSGGFFSTDQVRKFFQAEARVSRRF